MIDELLILSFAVGLSAISFFTYLMKLLNIPLNIYSIIIFSLILIGVFVKKFNKEIRNFRVNLEPKYNKTNLLILVIFLIALITRLLPVKDMLGPLWYDPAIYTTIARLILNNNGIPDTWSPFVDADLTLQYGLPSILAWISIISDISLARSILLLTMLVHILIPFGLFFLSKQLFRSKSKQIWVLLLSITAISISILFVSGTNANVMIYFTVPVLVGLLMLILLKGKPSFTNGLLLAILTAGSALIHPYALFFIAILLVPFLFLICFRNFNTNQILFSIIFAFFLPMLIISFYFLPALNSTYDKVILQQEWYRQSWFIRSTNNILYDIFIEPLYFLFINPTGKWYINILDFSVFGAIVSAIFVFLFFGAFMLILFDRNQINNLLIVWFLTFILFSTVLSRLPLILPGQHYIFPPRIKFLIVLPISFILGNFLGSNVTDKFKNFNISKIKFLIIIPLIFSLLIQYNYISKISAKSVINEDDAFAINWISENIESDAIIFNILVGYEPGGYIGDSGQWIPPLANKQVFYPAIHSAENVNSDKINEKLNLMRLISEKKMNSGEFLSLLKENSIDYIFISGRKMAIHESLFSEIYLYPLPEDFSEDYYSIIFRKNDVYILAPNYN